MVTVRAVPSGLVLRLTRRELLTVANAADAVRRHLPVWEAAARMGDREDNPYLDVLRARWRTALDGTGRSHVELVATPNDIWFMKASLNEVCNGFHTKVDFADEVGTDHSTALRLLGRMRRVLDMACALAEEHGLSLGW